ncbi:MAG: hypothetical protein HUU22_15865 [Phycisphaerae bacterium]|nr:hypothetical protein [Phycisphaerae bacterium]NUQ47497.1 hypothetical protein [Phycisphaerae bacterium]
MTRILLVVILLSLVGIAVIDLRKEMARTSYRIQALHQKQIRLEQELWSRDIELARLRVPERLRARVAEFGLPLLPPRGERIDLTATRAAGHGAIRTDD